MSNFDELQFVNLKKKKKTGMFIILSVYYQLSKYINKNDLISILF